MTTAVNDQSACHVIIRSYGTPRANVMVELDLFAVKNTTMSGGIAIVPDPSTSLFQIEEFTDSNKFSRIGARNNA